MKKIQTILKNLPTLQIKGSLDRLVNDLQIDSRNVSQGSAFIAVKGLQLDGHLFIGNAIAKGAGVIVCEKMPKEYIDDITYIQVENSNNTLGFLSHNFYDQPSAQLKLVGVTGTNGKTTIATLLFKLFTQFGHQCGLISTVQNQIQTEIIPSTHTTPDAIQLNQLLKLMLDKSCSYVFMEVSSHSIHQQRISGLVFSGGVFSNISHDHLDYHKTFDEYISVKKKFFDDLPATAFAISNRDDKRGEVMLQNTIAKKYYYALKSVADCKGKILENALTGLQMSVNDKEVHFKLIGEFNAYNLLAVYSSAICMGQKRDEILTILSGLSGAEGRFDYMINNVGTIGIIDYAHSPDALKNVLQTIRKLRKGDEQIITVIGCGGDRDKSKRPIMAQTACDLSDRAIFTSDNPRTENSEEILRDMEAGLTSAFKRKHISILDRREAIKTAVALSRRNDIVLVAGKGHEKYQEIKGIKHPFNDKEILKEMMEIY